MRAKAHGSSLYKCVWDFPFAIPSYETLYFCSEKNMGYLT